MTTTTPAPPPATSTRLKVHFPSGDTTCAAWHYPGTNGACVVMAGGSGVTKEPGTDPFAGRFADDGFTVLAFDYRHLGESGGQPRQVVPIGEQHADWRAAIAFARALPEVDPARVAIWGYSASGGHVFPVAARGQELAAAISHAPLADGPAATRGALRQAPPLTLLRLTARGVRDAVGGVLGRAPLLVPLAGERGTVAAVPTPDANNGARALNPGNRYPEWQQEMAARSALRISFYRPGRYASRVRCPVLVIAYEQDGAALPGPAIRAAQRAPHGELVRLPGGHYEGYLAGHERAVELQLDFLRRHLLSGGV
jgi:uncharacterized protein